ncbi:MAG TPA: nucleotide exchange factor GrpE [Phycisphaerales bacterium]|nr:nucleotide exchange factor GrpE [Phycisphaerales bacterium]
MTEGMNNEGCGECGHEGGEPGARIAELEAALEQEKSRNLRLMADFQNYQRRALANEDVAKQQGASGVVQSIVGVIDHFDLALGQDTSKASAEQIVEGVRVIREELLRALARHGVSPMSPGPNDEFVPGRHEAIMQQEAPGVGKGRVAATLQAGYVVRDASGERVIRPAKVSVAS